MKVNIGSPYPDGRIYWDKLSSLGIPDWLNVAIHAALEFFCITSKKQKVDVKIHGHDVWSADHTLALVILPVLKELFVRKDGFPSEMYDQEGVETEEDGVRRWSEILSKMIWSFEQIVDDNWEDQYYEGVGDYQMVPCDIDGNIIDIPEGKADLFTVVEGPNHTLKFDSAGYNEHYKKLKEGLELFGKYYLCLWC